MIREGNLPGVLVVDDEAPVRSFLTAALEAMARVVEAGDAEQALEILANRAQSTDLALVDHVLPRRSGLEVLQAIKQSWPWIPVVILTGFGSEELAVQVLRAGASDYLRKPIELNVLLRTVAGLMTRRGEPRTVTRPMTARADSGPPAISPTSIGAGSRPRPVHPNIRRALAFMSVHFAEAVTLAAVAREAGFSRFHFCRLFHQETGVPFHEYLHDLRVRQAKALLADRYLRVSDVAYAVGFNDLPHFDRTFRKIVGCSPSEYRASLQCA
jgi:YesN/AraC family two-component response regulator